MTEADLLAEVTALCDRLGLLWHHDPDPHRFGLRRIREWFRARGRPGFPDLVIAGPGGYLFAELKSDDGDTSAEQDMWAFYLTRDEANRWTLWRPADCTSGRIRNELHRLSLCRPSA